MVASHSNVYPFPKQEPQKLLYDTLAESLTLAKFTQKYAGDTQFEGTFGPVRVQDRSEYDYATGRPTVVALALELPRRQDIFVLIERQTLPADSVLAAALGFPDMSIDSSRYAVIQLKKNGTVHPQELDDPLDDPVLSTVLADAQVFISKADSL